VRNAGRRLPSRLKPQLSNESLVRRVVRCGDESICADAVCGDLYADRWLVIPLFRHFCLPAVKPRNGKPSVMVGRANTRRTRQVYIV
jgi:hypothetical protein